MNRIELGLTKLKNLFHGPKIPPLAQFLNLWSLCDGVLVGVNLDMSTVYELEGDNIFLMDPPRQETFAAQTRSFLNALPPDATLQFLVQIRQGDPVMLAEHQAAAVGSNSDELSRLMIEKKCEFMRGKFLQRRRQFLFVTSHPKERRTPLTFILPSFKRPWREVTRQFHEERLKEHASLEQTVTERLHALGMRHKKLAPQEMLDLVFAQLNPGLPHGPKMAELSPRRTLREQLVRHPLREEFDEVAVNGTHYRGLSLLKLPELSHAGFTQKLLNGLWPDCDFCLTVHSLDTERAMSSLKLRNNITRTLAFSTWTKNYEAEQKHLELDELLKEIRGSAQRLFKFGLSVLIRGESPGEAKDKANPVIGAFHDFASAQAVSDDMNHFRLFLQSIPGHGELNDRKFYIQTDALAGMLPLSGTWRGSREKKMLFETPLGELSGLDPFDDDLPAKHGLILGTTGSGKSFTTNYILSNFMTPSKDNHVVVIDVGGSYRKLAHNFSGEYLEVSLSEDFGFNPFPARNVIAPNGEFDDEAVAYLSLLISRMCMESGASVSVHHKSFLEKAIKTAYERKEQVLLSDVRAVLGSLSDVHPGAKTFSDALELWTTGMYGRLFNRPGALDIANRLVVFDLQNLENHPDLQGVYFFVIRSIIGSKLQNRNLKKIIAVDEGWKFFNDDVGAALIESLYRTARKFNGAVFSISQSPADFLDTKAAKAIISNSYIKYILKLTKGHELLPQFDLNPNEIEAVKQLESKQGVYTDLFVKFGTRSLVARLEPCPLDYWICTTDPKDRVMEDQFKAANPGLSQREVLLKLSEARR